MTNKSYRCCLTDHTDRVVRTERIERLDDASAVLQAERLMAASSHYSAELWDGSRLVGKWGRVAINLGGLEMSAALAT